MTKKFCLSHLISQEPYIIWLSFTLHLSKMISLDNFFIFCKFWFFGLLVGKRTKNSPKWQKFLSIALHIWGTIHHVTVIYVCKMILSPCVFFNVKILIFQVVKGLKGQKIAQNVENFCLSHLIFQKPYIIRSSFIVHMYL